MAVVMPSCTDACQFSACMRILMSCMTAKNCWWPSFFSCFSSTSMKRDCIITQCIMPSMLMSLARNNPLVEWRCPVFQDLAKFRWNKGHYSLVYSFRSSSLLSNACTLASRMLGKEDPCGWDCSWCLIPLCLPRCFLLSWDGCIDGSSDGLACLCGQGRSWRSSPPPFLRCLHLKTSTSQGAAESAGGESTKLWVDHFPILMRDS